MGRAVPRRCRVGRDEDAGQCDERRRAEASREDDASRGPADAASTRAAHTLRTMTRTHTIANLEAMYRTILLKPGFLTLNLFSNLFNSCATYAPLNETDFLRVIKISASIFNRHETLKRKIRNLN